MTSDNYYLSTDRITLNSFEENVISQKYNEGYVFTRLGKGIMDQTRSLRINLSHFELNSENRRILRKTEDLELQVEQLPLSDYSWEIHKMGKDFYSTKFGDSTMSAAKIKELFQDQEKSNMNTALVYDLKLESEDLQKVGYCLSYLNSSILHYSYPFYSLDSEVSNLGMGMMVKAIEWATEVDLDYVYLGSVVSSASKYKLQFDGLEWFDTDAKEWSTNLDKLTLLINN